MDAENTHGNAKKVIGRPFENGNPGKAPGTQNHLTRTVKQAVLEAFNQLQDNETHNLVAFAEKYPRDFYQIAARLIPTDIKADIRFTKVALHIVRTNPTAGTNGGQVDTPADITPEPTNGTE